MLAYFLSVIVGSGSVGMYFTAFLFPEIYRKQDLLWSGVGLLYALVLWVEANQLSGGLLVGQTASVLLLGWFAWQNITLRQQLTNFDQQISSLPPPWIEIRQEFLVAEQSTGPVVDQGSEEP